MPPNKITNILEVIVINFNEQKIPFALIGALALGLYGLPRYTSDIDCIADGVFRDEILSIMERLGYTCYHKTNSFAQFDSESGDLGNIDFLFVYTQDGRDILNRSIIVEDEQLGKCKVVQPSDYIILKVMAIANNPKRSIKDEADIVSLLESYNNKLIPDYFELLDEKRIKITNEIVKFL